MRSALILILLAANACTPMLPVSRDTISSDALDAPYPALVPLDPLLARAEAGSTIELQTEALEARVAGLKARAAALKGRSIFDGATRLKLLNAGKRNAARRLQ